MSEHDCLPGCKICGNNGTSTTKAVSVSLAIIVIVASIIYWVWDHFN